MALETARERYSTRLWSDRGKLRERNQNSSNQRPNRQRTCLLRRAQRGLQKRWRILTSARSIAKANHTSPASPVLVSDTFRGKAFESVRPSSVTAHDVKKMHLPPEADQSFLERDTSPTRSCGRIHPSLPTLCDKHCFAAHQSHYLRRRRVSL